MASNFDRRFAAAGLNRLLAEMGEPATYTPTSGLAVEVTGMFNEYTAAKDKDDSGLVFTREARFTCLTTNDATYGGIEDLQPAGSITITASGETWLIDGMPQRLAGYIEIKLVITSRMEKTRRDYRR